MQTFLYENCDNPILKIDKNGKILDANPAFRNEFGIKKPYSSDRIFKALPNFPKLDEIVKNTFYQHGDKLKYRIEKSPVHKDHGYMLLFHKQPGDILLQLGQAAVLSNISAGVIIVDKECKIVHYNDHQLQFDGFKESEIIGKTTSEVEGIDPEDSGLEQVLKSGEESLDYEHHYNSRLNRYVTMEGHLFPLRHANKLIGAAGIYQRLSTFEERTNNPDEKKAKNKTLSNPKKKLYTFDDILGNAPCLEQSIEIAKRVSSNDSSVFIYGETGVGKELFAQSIHTASKRKNGPFIALNCSAIPETLFESMLFGSTKGAFTGSENTQGLLEMADKGTILFDEINSMPIYLQNKLLRAIEERTVRPLGSKKEIPFDVRIISCSTEHPDKVVSQNKIRKDLYYRIAVVLLEVPSLQQRPDDIILYARAFITSYNNTLGKTITSIHPETEAIMQEYTWPGNIRQLRHYVECIMNATPHGEFSFSHHAMPSYFSTTTQGVSSIFSTKKSYSKNSEAQEIEPQNTDFFEKIRNKEKQNIMDALMKTNGNISKAARILNLSRRKIQYRIKKYGLK